MKAGLEFHKMKKIKCLVSAGATREYFDPVRFVSNPSTGKMGLAIAKAAADMGWQATLLLAPSQLKKPDGVEVIDVVSADDMLREARKRFDDCDILIMTAAVCDMRPKFRCDKKVKKEALNMNVEFEQTPDILKTLSREKKNQILIGFAAETDNLIEYAKGKLKAKKLDVIAANNVAAPDSGFASDNNEITLIFKDLSQIHLPRASKEELARKLVEILNDKFFE